VSWASTLVAAAVQVTVMHPSVLGRYAVRPVGDVAAEQEASAGGVLDVSCVSSGEMIGVVYGGEGWAPPPCPVMGVPGMGHARRNMGDGPGWRAALEAHGL
jgi:hypothetical protein